MCTTKKHVKRLLLNIAESMQGKKDGSDQANNYKWVTNSLAKKYTIMGKN